MEYEISDDQTFAGDYEAPCTRPRRAAVDHAAEPAPCDRAVHIPEQED